MSGGFGGIKAKNPPVEALFHLRNATSIVNFFVGSERSLLRLELQFSFEVLERGNKLVGKLSISCVTLKTSKILLSDEKFN